MRNVNRADKSLIKKINTTSILNVIRQQGPISRADIAKTIGLNPATVSSNINELIEKRLIKEIGIGESSGGRKPIMLILNSSELRFVGVDMGITKVSTGIMDLDGNILKKLTLSYDDYKTMDEIFKVIKQSIASILEGEKLDNVVGIGMGVHGLVDAAKGMSIYSPAFDWHNVPIASIFEEEFKLPVVIENDARAMALGEKWFGAAKNSNNFILLNIGSGVGAGIYLNGELYKGSGLGAGEIGHVSITKSKVKCKCGKEGCVEAIASGEGITNRFVQEIKEGKISSILKTKKIDNITTIDIYEAAKNGDELSLDIFNETGEYLGIIISMILNVLNPDKVILAGGVSKAGDFIFKAMKETIGEKTMVHNMDSVAIEIAELGDDTGIVGAATLILKELFSYK